jgi:hypothetical protein
VPNTVILDLKDDIFAQGNNVFCFSALSETYKPAPLNENIKHHLNLKMLFPTTSQFSEHHSFL